MLSPMHPWRNACATVALLAATPFVHAQTIHTVDVEGRGDYADIQSAVDAANSGDVIYVMDPQATYDDEVPINAYAGFTIDGKSLSVVANPNGMWSVGSVTIRDLAEDQFVVLSGLPLGHDVVPPGSLGAPAGLGDAGARVTISDALGPVLLQHCAIVGRRASTALDVQRSTAVFVTSCEINTPWDAPTVHLSDCYCALDRSYVRGGQASTIHQSCSASLRDGFPGIVLAAGANLRLGSALIEGGFGEWVIEHGFPPKECYGSPGDPIAFSGGTLLIDVEYPAGRCSTTRAASSRRTVPS